MRSSGTYSTVSGPETQLVTETQEPCAPFPEGVCIQRGRHGKTKNRMHEVQHGSNKANLFRVLDLALDIWMQQDGKKERHPYAKRYTVRIEGVGRSRGHVLNNSPCASYRHVFEFVFVLPQAFPCVIKLTKYRIYPALHTAKTRWYKYHHVRNTRILWFSEID